MLRPAVFLDRDGIINKEKGYVSKISDFEWIEGSKESIKFLNENNYHVFVVTNQSGIAKGYYLEEEVNLLHSYINKELSKQNSHIDEFFISPYHPDIPEKYTNLSHLRKPKIGMLLLAESKWQIDKDKSFLIGDQDTDIECAIQYGIRGYKFEGGNLLDFIRRSENI